MRTALRITDAAVLVYFLVVNKAAGIVESVHAMLALRYPVFEVLVVDDGSTDATFERLRAEFDLVEVPRVIPHEVPVRAAVRSVHVPRLRGDPLVEVRKDNGGKTDALNVGLNLARYPLTPSTGTTAGATWAWRSSRRSWSTSVTGTWDALHRRPRVWGVMQRQGFSRVA